jgi:tetratricopeptide (TPR) repeat protein
MNPHELNEANQKLLLEAYEFHRQNNLPQSIEQFDKILTTEKDYIIISNICFFKARALRELNRQEDAENCIEEGLRHNASSSFLLYLKATIIAWRDYSSLPLDEAIQKFQLAMRFSEQAQINFKKATKH